jgi:hypothetical protein
MTFCPPNKTFREGKKEEKSHKSNLSSGFNKNFCLVASFASSVSLSMQSENASGAVPRGAPKLSTIGRTAARKAATEEATLHHSHDTTGIRGFTTNQRLSVAGIAQSRRALIAILGNCE